MWTIYLTKFYSSRPFYLIFFCKHQIYRHIVRWLIHHISYLKSWSFPSIQLYHQQWFTACDLHMLGPSSVIKTIDLVSHEMEDHQVQKGAQRSMVWILDHQWWAPIWILQSKRVSWYELVVGPPSTKPNIIDGLHHLQPVMKSHSVQIRSYPLVSFDFCLQNSQLL